MPYILWFSPDLGANVPFAKGIVLRPVVKKPKKPNSANRKVTTVGATYWQSSFLRPLGSSFLPPAPAPASYPPTS